MPTKAELEATISRIQKQAEKTVMLQDTAVYTPADNTCEACYNAEATTVLVTPERPIYICADCLSALECFLGDYNIRIG